MALKKKLRRLAPWAVRQMRRVRSVYIAGIALWTLALWIEVSERPGSPQMWLTALILGTFVALLSVISVRLWWHAADRRGAPKSRAATPGVAPKSGAAVRS